MGERKYNGEGYAKYANGTTYQGTFLDAMHDGKGIMKSPDGYL